MTTHVLSDWVAAARSERHDQFLRSAGHCVRAVFSHVGSVVVSGVWDLQPRPHGDGGGGEGGEISFLGARCLRQAEANLREFYLGRSLAAMWGHSAPSCRGLVVMPFGSRLCGST